MKNNRCKNATIFNLFTWITHIIIEEKYKSLFYNYIRFSKDIALAVPNDLH